MHMVTGAIAVLALQQGFTSPPAGDTVGYWQQRVAYAIVARLDESAQRIRASGVMRYVNNSPDTLRALYFHQYLNAFRPGSKWSAADEREGRTRFQRLSDPDFAYERFTAPVRVGGVAAQVTYPGAPDSTVARVALPSALAPGDSVVVAFDWDARPSTLPRRQGRRGRHWDLAQWYPRIVPYDRGGWQFNALQPAGEFYGEFGSYDVTLVLRDDQVIGATGVPVSGDPGWSRARRGGQVRTASGAYGAAPPMNAGLPAILPGTGEKVVRFLARDVHHFAWSASPDYRYEGGVYARTPPPGRVRAWDSVAIHVLYQPGDDSTWGRGLVVQRTANTLAWLENIFGRYAYPQMTVLHRIEGGGTEFPMMQMNGSPSQGLNLHEGGHVWVHGILANNEWRSGWLDEGFTSYQTEWAQGLTPQERVRAGIVDRFAEAEGYRGRAVAMTMSRFDAIGLGQALADLEGDAEPIGLAAHEFRDFGTYNQMIYTRAQVMYGQLRDVLGDSLWIAFLGDYYERWALKHVDERAMRGSAERVSGQDLGWFFQQWVHETGVMDYALGHVRQSREGASWVTTATVVKRGEYAHPIRVGVRTAAGWTTVQAANALATRQQVRIVTAGEPLEVRLDPHHFSWDWDRRNDVRGRDQRVVFDWPFLRQADRESSITAVRPLAWYSGPGGLNLALRGRSSYLDEIDRYETGGAYAFRTVPTSSAVQVWLTAENPYLPGRSRPLMGWGATAGKLDDVVLLEGRHRVPLRGRWSGWMGGRLTYSDALDDELVPELWSPKSALDYTLTFRPRFRRAAGHDFLNVAAMVGTHDGDVYHKQEISLGAARSVRGVDAKARVYFGNAAVGTPGQRSLSLSAEDPATTFLRHWWRPRDGILKQDGINGLPIGGPGLRAYHWGLTSTRVFAANVDVARVVARSAGDVALAWRLHGFADAAAASGPERSLVDAGLGVSVAGRLFDRDIRLRLDAPFYVSEPRWAIARSGTIAWRYVLSFTDIWD